MSVVQEPEVKWAPDQMVEVVLGEPDDFLKVRETLTRIGVASRKEKKIYQSCHILHKQGRYFIVHFKELFALDGKHANLTQNDVQRRNRIVQLLSDWGLVSVLNADGNLFDAVSYAALVALSLTKFNKYKIDKEGNAVQTDTVIGLPVKFTPISITQIKIDDHIIVDPTAFEESLMNSRITLTADGDGNICAGQKGLAGPLSPEEIISCSKQVLLISEKIKKILKKAIVNGKKEI